MGRTHAHQDSQDFEDRHLNAELSLSIPDAGLPDGRLSRRRMLRAVGLLGIGAVAGVIGANLVHADRPPAQPHPAVSERPGPACTTGAPTTTPAGGTATVGTPAGTP